jgi:hypothetical protein
MERIGSTQSALLTNGAAASGIPSTPVTHPKLSRSELTQNLEKLIARSKLTPITPIEPLPELNNMTLVDFLRAELSSPIHDLGSQVDKALELDAQLLAIKGQISQNIGTEQKRPNQGASPESSWFSPISALKRLANWITQPTEGALSQLRVNKTLADDGGITQLKNSISKLDNQIIGLKDGIINRIQVLLAGAHITNLSHDKESIVEALLISSGHMTPAGILSAEVAFTEIQKPSEKQTEIETEANLLGDTEPELGLQNDRERPLFEEQTRNDRNKYKTITNLDDFSENNYAARFIVQRLLDRGVTVQISAKSNNLSIFIDVGGYSYKLTPINRYTPKTTWEIAKRDDSVESEDSVATISRQMTKILESSELSERIGSNDLLVEVDRIIHETSTKNELIITDEFNTDEYIVELKNSDTLEKIINNKQKNSLADRLLKTNAKISIVPDPDNPQSVIDQDVYISYPDAVILISRSRDSSIIRQPEEGDLPQRLPSWSIQIDIKPNARLNIPTEQNPINARNLEPCLMGIIDELEIQSLIST